ncbi:MAG: type transport system ATP-binding protein, partial [Actinomycetota bacterium]|nr:type transport system ATP-binding protein [Actinomycetota bacterium]
MESPQPVVNAVSLTKVFGNVCAVDDLSFRVDRGQVCGILGPNGAGKTTALRLLVGLVSPTSGDAQVLGVSMTPSNPVLSRVGSSIARPGFVPFLSGMRNLRLHWEQSGGDFSEIDVEQVLAVAGLGPAINRKVGTYSPGMLQRLGLARAMLGRPELLILDEPTNGLEREEKRDIWARLSQLAAQGVTVVLSSNLLSDVEHVCSHVYVLNQGKLVADGTVGGLMESAGSVFFRVGDVSRAAALLAAHAGVGSARAEADGVVVELEGAARSELVSALVQAGVQVDAVEPS